MGGTVVAELHFSDSGKPELNFLYGEEPFVGSCRSALAEMKPNGQEESAAIVVVHFRQPYLHTIGSREEGVNVRKPKAPLPYPVQIVQPDYPASSLGQGSVVLRADISDEGTVSDVRVLKPMGAFTEACVEAVRKWAFHPAGDSKGKAKTSHAYIVIVYRYVITG